MTMLPSKTQFFCPFRLCVYTKTVKTQTLSVKKAKNLSPKKKSVKSVVVAHSAFASKQSEKVLFLPALEFQTSFMSFG